MPQRHARSAGIDIGGTKIETQIFDEAWHCIDRWRVPTPTTYSALLDTIAAQVHRAGDVPTGLALAGQTHPVTGLALAANLPVTGRPFAADLRAAACRPLVLVNDAQAFTLSEARLGAATGARRVAGVIFGTGIGGGFARDGLLDGGLCEFGHLPVPAGRGLPVLPCGCGRAGCIETLASGRGIGRLAQVLTGREMDAPMIAAGRYTDADCARVWAAWTELGGALLHMLTLTLSPDVIVLGGGLSQATGVANDLHDALRREHFAGFPVPQVVVAAGGDTSGARGAALAAAGA